MGSPDAPELVALLQAAGFSLSSFNFDPQPAPGSKPQEGCRVQICCLQSGVHAELTSTAPCRCTRFSKSAVEPHELREKASCWQVTSSQESLNSAWLHGSSVLPEIQPARLAVMREVLEILQEEMTQATLPPRSAERKKRLEPTSSIDVSSSVNRSFESLQVMDRVSLAANIERRASISCTEDLKDRSHGSWNTSILSQRSSTADSMNSSSSVPVNTTTSVRLHLQSVIKSASEALKLLPQASVDDIPVVTNKHQQLIRKTTFNIPDKQLEIESALKKARLGPLTPGPRRSDSLRSRPKPTSITGRPPLPTPKTDPIRRRTIATTVLPRTPMPTRHSSHDENALTADRAKPMAHVSVFKRLTANTIKKKAPSVPAGQLPETK